MKAILLILLALPAFPQNAKQVRDRGQVRAGSQEPVSRDIATYTGILVDASCADRTSMNLRQKPAGPDIAPAGPGAKPPADVAAHQNPDVLMRQMDPSCAVTGATKSYALFLPNGRFVVFDEGGNTLAGEYVYSKPEGRAMMNGTGGPLKPWVSLRGRLWGDQLLVDRFQ